MFHLILPDTYPTLGCWSKQFPMFFLMGPVLGGGDWQRTMTETLVERVGECIIVNPNRYEPTHPHYKYRMRGPGRSAYDAGWAWHHQQMASAGFRRGCVILWLACESKTEPRNDGNPYAMETRDEIGWWRKELVDSPDVRLVVGAEPGFPGLERIQQNFDIALGYPFKIYETMEEVVQRTVGITRELIPSSP